MNKYKIQLVAQVEIGDQEISVSIRTESEHYPRNVRHLGNAHVPIADLSTAADIAAGMLRSSIVSVARDLNERISARAGRPPEYPPGLPWPPPGGPDAKDR